MMDYNEFVTTLQEEIQSRFMQHIDFISGTMNRVNGAMDSLTLRFDGQNLVPVIYPEKLYEAYKDGHTMSEITADVAGTVKDSVSSRVEIPEFSAENARKCVKLSLIDRERNQHLLDRYPHKDVCNLAAVPRWHISDDVSFLVDNDLIQMLKLTKEEILDIAQKNTESEDYLCRDINSIIRASLVADGVDADLADNMFPSREPFLYVLTSSSYSDGSRAVLSERFMQDVAGRIGADELYLLPSSRDEVLAVSPAIAGDIEQLRDIVMSVNRDPRAIQPEQILSDSVYCYNARTHTLSVCDCMELNHAEPVQAAKHKNSRGRGR